MPQEVEWKNPYGTIPELRSGAAAGQQLALSGEGIEISASSPSGSAGSGGGGGCADAVDQGDEAGTILVGDSRESQTESAVRDGMLNRGLGTNLAFGNQEIDSSDRARWLR
jgi:hypothetical protein